MNLFNKAAENTEEREYFYIPIVEGIKGDDYEKLRSWSFAKHENRRRRFYPSPESLYQAESARVPTVSCYKVSLTEAKKQQLEDQGNYSAGFLHFKASEIISLIAFRAGVPFEEANPFQAEENTLQAAISGP